MPEEKHQVRVHIDQKERHSPNPTKGPDLYELGEVKEGLVLYREVQGDHEDTLVRIDSPRIDLKEDEHFHSGEPSEKHYIIFVNTAPKVVDHDVLTFDEIVKIAFPIPPTGQDIAFTVSFEHAKSEPHFGDLEEGGKVTVRKFGTWFDVDHHNRS